jgi:hypothetical protein
MKIGAGDRPSVRHRYRRVAPALEQELLHALVNFLATDAADWKLKKQAASRRYHGPVRGIDVIKHFCRNRIALCGGSDTLSSR